MLTKKHFEKAAELISARPLEERTKLADLFIAFFRDDNPRFDATRFDAACKTFRAVSSTFV